MKYLIKYINLKKSCAILTVLSFLLLNINSNLYAISAVQPTNNQFNNLFETTNLIQQRFGKITNFEDLGSNITVINIQDLHCHLQTQENISEILTEIDNIRPIDTILSEGGYENFNLNWISNLKDEKFKKEIINKLLSDNIITGTEYYALINEKENILKGLDDKQLHQKNISRLNFIIDNKKVYTDVLNKINQEISILNNKYINQRNRRFSRILTDYNNGKISSTRFYKILFKYITNINDNNQNYNNIVPIVTRLYPNISKYLTIYSASSDINSKLVTSQLQSFILILKSNLPYNVYNKLLSYTDNFSNTFKLAEFIKNYSKEFNIDITTQFPELNKFFTNLKLSEDINPIQLLKEEELLISQIRMALSYDNTEYEITFISDFFNYFEKYLNYSLTAYEWQYYKENYDKFIDLYSKYSNINRINTIEKDFTEINSYYETNNTRNDIFISKILNNINTDIIKYYEENRDILTTLKQSDKIIVVVAGGFHSEELKDFLSKRNINTITITPTVTEDTSTAKITYEQNAKLQNKVLSQALALRMASSAPSLEQKTLLVQAAIEIYGDNNINTLEQFLENEIKIIKLDNDKYKLIFKDGNEIIIDKKNTSNIKEVTEVSSLFKNTINSVYDVIPSFLPKKGLQSIFVPETYSVFKNLSLQLFKHNIYLSNGVIFDIENSQYNGQDLDGIQPEIYSTFLPEIQQMLLDKVNPKPLLSLTNKVTLKQVISEELFRIIPMAISVLNPYIGIPIFILSQFIFVYAHLITNYMHEKNNQTVSGYSYIKQLKDIIFNKEVRREFKKHIETKSAKQYTTYIGKQTVILSLPYLVAILFSPASIIIAPILSSLLATFIHYKHNISNDKNKRMSIVDSQEEKNLIRQKEDHDIAIILVITFAINIVLAVLSTASPAITLIRFISLIFPLNSTLTLIWSFAKKSYQKRIFGEEDYESKYFSNIPEEDYDYSQGTMDVTIQIPVYTESNDVIFETIRQSMDAVENYKGKKFGAKANIVISDDGLAVLLDGDISRKHIEQIMQTPADRLTAKEKQAVERIKFYRTNNISFVARPRENRAGLFKKASNLNHTYRTIDKIKKNIPIEDGTYYEGEDLEVYDVILMLDKDSGLHKDILSVSVPKFIKDEKLAYTENVTVPSNRGESYVSKTIAAFTSFLYQYVYPSNALTGGIVPFVGHNGFIRKSALEEVGFWPKDRVSEDYYTSTLFSARGYHGQYLNFKGYEFKEMVSRSFIEEASKIGRYTFGLLELIFNKNIIKRHKEGEKGILTDWMKEFLFSKDIKWYQKIHFFVYPLSYVNIISIIPVAIITGLILNSGTFNLMVVAIGAIPLVLALYKIYTKTDLLSEEEKSKKTAIFKNIFQDAVILSATFISFSHIMMTGVIKFLHNPNNAKFNATNVDKDDYTLKEAFSKIGNILKDNKSIFIYIVPFIIKIIVMPSSLFDIQNTVIPFGLIFAFVLSNFFLNPFVINSIKNTISNLFKQSEEKVKVIYSSKKNAQQMAYPLSIVDIESRSVQIYIFDDTSQFDKDKLINTGLKVKGKTIWQIKENDTLIFVADGLDFKDIARAINNSRTLKQQIKKILNLKNNIELNIEAALILDGDSEDIYMEGENILISNTENITSTFVEILKSFGLVFSQKMMISLADVSDENLYQALSKGSLKKVITEKQFEYLKNNFEQQGMDFAQELMNLREKGIEIYIISDSEINDNLYKQFGISGKIKGSKIYDYFSQEEIEFEKISDDIQIKVLEQKIIYSQTPLLINLKTLQNIFSLQSNILDTYSAFDALLGKIKIKLGLKNITLNDIKEFAYNINLSVLPSIDQSQTELMLNSDIYNFISNLNIQPNNIISVILNDTKISEDNKKIFLDIIKQRILVKTELQKQNIETINDKKVEKLLGKLLLIQALKTTTAQEREVFYEDILKTLDSSNYMQRINELQDKAINEEDIVAVNTIIEIILFMQERRIAQIETQTISAIDYKQMLAAA